MSRAVEKWPSWVRPLALRKVVDRIPSARAIAVICAPNLGSDPASPSPMTVAASLADFTAAARIR